MTESHTLPTIQNVSTLTTVHRAAVLDTLFEPCTQLHTLSVTTLSGKTFSSYSDLIAAVGQQLTDLYQSNLEADQRWLKAILCAHPRLGEKTVESELSRKEQDAMRQAEGGGESEDVAEKLKGLNDKYEDAFPGLRYV